MKDKLKELKAFVKKHEKVIIVATTAIGGVIVYAITKKSIANRKAKLIAEEAVKAQLDYEADRVKRIAELAPNWSTGTLTEIAKDFVYDPTQYELIVNDITPADLGKVDEDILKLEGVTDETTVSMLAYTIAKKD